MENRTAFLYLSGYLVLVSERFASSHWNSLSLLVSRTLSHLHTILDGVIYSKPHWSTLYAIFTMKGKKEKTETADLVENNILPQA